jgi:hypothetical protein
LPRQNRVTPFGEIVATECRGTLMGNRGCLHDEQQRIRRRFACKRWIVCVLQFKGRRRTVMTPGRYTELFFLDEATALAAGHRPCFECQRGRFRLFQEAWGTANADAIDAALHAERLGPKGEKRTYSERLSRLPNGAMTADGSSAFLVWGEALFPWTPGGYGPAVPKRDAVVQVLTPRSVVRALHQGYPVQVHPSARAITRGTIPCL